ncbi:metallophosphoesterase [Pseudodesulfovibrio sp. zrk46]|uniref:metallophosphoesterase n=1 Tax=Pseudodesulfovibrio sp. zrk46 TaxID=2725288 RepID=UPI001FFD4B20|nr:metallophosphoesterase [Pseudodesulfovibrio sp. zrk46]
MWLIIVLSVATFLTLYLGLRLINPAPLARKWKVASWLLVITLLFAQRLSWYLWRGDRTDTLLQVFDWAGFTFLGLVSFIVVLMLLRDVPILFQGIMSTLTKLFVRRSKRPYFIKPNRERRRFMLNATNGVIMTAALPLSGYAVYGARRKPEVVHNDLPVIDLPEGLEGFTIAQITDTHVGPTIRGAWVQQVVDEINSLSPDLIVHTGDMVDGSVASLNGAVRPFGDLSAPHGVFMCTGNHEYYSGVHEWIGEANRLGMRPLLNENTLIDTGNGRLLLAGVTDYRADRLVPEHASSPKQAMANAPDHDVSILLAHQPKSIYAASNVGFDIQLSGHTHGGQFAPWTWAIDLFQPYVKGLHLHEKTLIYVSVGTGYWGPPMRLGTKPEITLHTLRKA